MTAWDDWAASVSDECVLSAPRTLKEADEWLFGEQRGKGRTPGELFRRATQSKARSVEERLSVNVNANQSFQSCIYNFCLKNE